MKSENKILIATGGTGGHIFPGYGIAKFLFKNNYSINIITDKRGLKYLKKTHNIEVKVISSDTIFSKNFILKVLSIFKIFFAILDSLIYLKKINPKIVLGMGGYSSFPVCAASKILKIPFIIYENNLQIGKANKYLLPFAEKIFVAYRELRGIKNKYLYKVVKTGNIVREEIFEFKRNQNEKKDILKILVLGGSQAARSFGEILPKVFKKCNDENIKLNIVQQCLDNQKIDIENFYTSNQITYNLFNFSDNILSYYSKIDLVITRAGSSVLAELLNCKIPFISIPLPGSADEHQYKNAKFFEDKGYALLVEEAEIESKLFSLIKSLHRDRSLLDKIIEKQKNYSDKDALKTIKFEIENIIL